MRKLGVLLWIPLSVVAQPVDFVRDIQPLLRTRCVACHGAAQQANGLRLDREEDARKGGYSGTVIRAGDAASSRLYQLISSGIQKDGATLRMPPAGPPLTSRETALLKQWIEEGARWGGSSLVAQKPAVRKPWSFQPLRRPAVPLTRRPQKNPIDAFVLAKLEQQGIQPSPEAPKYVLLRRAYLDLAGLPPTQEQAAAYFSDTRPDAYERLVDRLLESPHFGEKWARHWLDLARYADSEGGVQDYPRPFAWRYRQWVIDALNADMPFDRFTIEQLAGDLLPSPTLNQKIATGFHRNTITSREGGIDLEKLRYDQLIDRANTTGTVWLGLTFGCAQCHDHKYDPITQKDYYRLFAFFENTQELDLEAPLPGELGPYRQYIGIYLKERRKLLEDYKIAPVQEEWEENVRQAAADPGKRPNWDVSYDAASKLLDHGPRVLHKKSQERTRREQEAVTNHFVKYSAAGLGKQRYDDLKLKELDEKLKALNDKYPALSAVNVLTEDSQRSATRIRLRGNFKDLGVEVTPGTPESLPAMPPGPVDRLALARWIVSQENPLTARVAVNRLWQEVFGRGLVRTSEDLGMQGEKPSHPELLDFLAAEFRNGWSIKKVVRLMMTSSTYKQASHARPDLLSKDPANVLLARQSRFRLPAELIRDSALHVSGLLNDTVGGESVRPPQPEGVIDLQYSMKWEETPGRPRYRRGLYVHLQRTASYPLLMNFDAPDRTVSCARRETSNSPLQSLNLMNDPVFAEAAQALASRLIQAPEKQRLEHAFLLCYQRPPSPKERDLLASFLERRREMARANSKSNESMPAADLANIEPVEAVAWFGLSRALINSDEFLTRE